MSTATSLELPEGCELLPGPIDGTRWPVKTHGLWLGNGKVPATDAILRIHGKLVAARNLGDDQLPKFCEHYMRERGIE